MHLACLSGKICYPFPVRAGIDRPEEYMRMLEGKRTGAVLSPASVTSSGKPSADELIERAEARAFFSLEHGLFGREEAGKAVADELYKGVPVFSLYNGKGTVFPKEAISLIDVLVFDVQDLGLRFYTYIASLMAVLKADLPFDILILDRPNPFGRRVLGAPLGKDELSFVGPAGLPVMYSLTFGELALWYARKEDLRLPGVVKLEHWDQGPWPLDRPWVPTSPAIRSYEAAFLYSGLCFVEGTNLSEGRGTGFPFQLIGAPFIDPEKLLDGFEAEGFSLEAAAFTPSTGKWAGETCHGVFIRALDYMADPVAFSVRLLSRVFSLFPEASFLPLIDKLMGKEGRKGILDGGEGLLSTWERKADEFKLSLREYYIYRQEEGWTGKSSL